MFASYISYKSCKKLPYIEKIRIEQDCKVLFVLNTAVINTSKPYYIKRAHLYQKLKRTKPFIASGSLSVTTFFHIDRKGFPL